MSSGAAWGSRLFLMLATTTFVIANYQRPRDNSSLKNYEQIGGDHRTVVNASRVLAHLKYVTVPFVRCYSENGNIHIIQISLEKAARKDDGIKKQFTRDGSTNKTLLDLLKLQYLSEHYLNINVQLPPLRVPHLRHHHVTHWGPYFENAEGQWINGSQHVVLHLGATAMLDCRIAMLDKRTVMWMRKSADRAFLLTLGKEVHISDPRYSVNFQYPNNWRLKITAVQKEDRGLYVCEVNTHPPTMLVTNVTVLAPDIRIEDEASHELRDRYYKTGSVIELACIVRPAQPESRVPHPSWKKAGEMLPDHVNVYNINGSNDELVTTFHIDRAKKTDSGEYTCSLGQFTSTMVHIHVLNGEKQAAVHHDQWNAGRTNYHEACGSLFTVITAIQLFLHATYSSTSTIYLL